MKQDTIGVRSTAFYLYAARAARGLGSGLSALDPFENWHRRNKLTSDTKLGRTDVTEAQLKGALAALHSSGPKFRFFILCA